MFQGSFSLLKFLCDHEYYFNKLIALKMLTLSLKNMISAYNRDMGNSSRIHFNACNKERNWKVKGTVSHLKLDVTVLFTGYALHL